MIDFYEKYGDYIRSINTSYSACEGAIITYITYSRPIDFMKDFEDQLKEVHPDWVVKVIHNR